ncbi:uncharacterized protein LOC106363541 [Brassica napus]|uniref:uncharacterized protein LOC106363541 n=1 Tax=Brassica napus TaxID=3708 RepID=UPI0020786574|nr:uncharacterized protein LOC106363541 [Brassica napus]
MEVLTKLLEQAVEAGNIRLHPRCHDPRVTHLLFADDLLVFSDGSRHSITGIKKVLSIFKDWTRLDMNAQKSEIFFGGYSELEASVTADISGFKIGTFPTRYLGLPLNPSRISYATMQPFLERITLKLHSWTVKTLSFAGKMVLVASVIYGMNGTASAVGARVSWNNICKPKQEGGLGLRSLEEYQKVFELKRVWNCFSQSGSLWVAWLHCNVFNRKSFWTTNDSQRFSPTVRSMLQQKPLLLDFLRCIIGDGKTASFWHDYWTDLGPLISVFGHTGPRALRLNLESHVCDASQDGVWSLPHARSDEAVTLQIVLTTMTTPSLDHGADRFLWRNGAGHYVPKFSVKATWNSIRESASVVPWHSLASGRTTVATMDSVPSSLNAVSSLLSLRQVGDTPGLRVVLILLLQAIVYCSWRERNLRIFQQTSSTEAGVKAQVHRLLQDRLISTQPPTPASTLLQVYLSLLPSGP